MKKPPSINAQIGRDQACPRCGRMRTAAELNFEGAVHHGTRVECIDRRSCERARRKAER